MENILKLAVVIIALMISSCANTAFEKSAITTRVDRSQREPIPDDFTIRVLRVLPGDSRLCGGYACLKGRGTEKLKLYWTDRFNQLHEYEHIIFGPLHYEDRK